MQNDKQLILKIQYSRGRNTALVVRVVEKLVLLNQSMQIFSTNQDFAQNDFKQVKNRP
jgi:hypothetical protein